MFEGITFESCEDGVTIIVKFQDSQVRVSHLNTSVLVDIETLNGKRVAGTWAEAEEINEMLTQTSA